MGGDHPEPGASSEEADDRQGREGIEVLRRVRLVWMGMLATSGLVVLFTGQSPDTGGVEEPQDMALQYAHEPAAYFLALLVVSGIGSAPVLLFLALLKRGEFRRELLWSAFVVLVPVWTCIGFIAVSMVLENMRA